MYADKFIWRKRDKGDALYLHRIVVSPYFKGRKLYGVLLNWAIEHAKSKEIKYIRMDTWGDNPKIISYYESFGFRFVENYTSPNTADLPIPHRNLFFALLELDINNV